MRKKIIGILVFLLIVSMASGGWRYKRNFLTTAVDCAAGATLVNETGFTSVKVPIPWDVSIAPITVTFTRAAGSASTVDFYFRVSFDGGTTWADYIESIAVPTNHSVVSGTTVRVSKPVYFIGLSHAQLSKIVNNDVANALTACNASISW